MKVDEIIDAADELEAGRPEDCSTLLARMDVSWAGPARDRACDNIECQRTFWDHVLDFLLWLAEQILQLLDYGIDTTGGQSGAPVFDSCSSGGSCAYAVHAYGVPETGAVTNSGTRITEDVFDNYVAWASETG